MEPENTKIGFWQGMTTGMKVRLLVWFFYWGLAFWLISKGSGIGIGMAVLPILWALAKTWLLDSFLELDRHDTKGLLDYTLGHIWTGSSYVRAFFMIATVSLALGGLGWLGTADLRVAAQSPGLGERISKSAGNLATSTAEKTGELYDATHDTAKGWIAKAKGWFGSDDPAPIE